jgi:hypothetical protein
MAIGVILAACTRQLVVRHNCKWSIQLYKASDTAVSLSRNTGCIACRVRACNPVLLTLQYCSDLTRTSLVHMVLSHLESDTHRNITHSERAVRGLNFYCEANCTSSLCSLIIVNVEQRAH